LATYAPASGALLIVGLDGFAEIAIIKRRDRRIEVACAQGIAIINLRNAPL
jgi:LDH2 family malate/lactate/ureidoglycolate dehydrogenase